MKHLGIIIHKGLIRKSDIKKDFTANFHKFDDLLRIARGNGDGVVDKCLKHLMKQFYPTVTFTKAVVFPR